MKKFLSIFSSVIFLTLALAIPASAKTKTYYKTTINTSNYVTLRNLESSGYMNVSTSNSKITKNGVNCCTWCLDKRVYDQYFLFKNDGHNQFEVIPKIATSYRLNVNGESAKASANVNFWKSTGHATQKFVIMYEPAYKAYTIRSADNTSLCVAEAKNAKCGANICLEKCVYGDKGQLWTSSAFTTSTTTYDDTITSPVTNRKITSNFTPMYRSDVSLNSYTHVGVDYTSTTSNKTISCFYTGTVYKSGSHSSLGNYVVVKSTVAGTTFYHYYYHLSSISVKANQNIKTGQTIGVMGCTGDATGVHLHFQITKNGYTLNCPKNTSANKNVSASSQAAMSSYTWNGVKFINPEKAIASGGITFVINA